jgi:hypothetical protein
METERVDPIAFPPQLRADRVNALDSAVGAIDHRPEHQSGGRDREQSVPAAQPVTAPPRTAQPAPEPLRNRLTQSALRGLLAAAAAAGVAVLHDVHDPGVLCPLRRFTGIPCPACGSTTVFIEAGHAHWAAALTANPVTVIAVLGLLTAPLGTGARWWSLTNRRRSAIIVAALAVAWAWQLNRLGVHVS